MKKLALFVLTTTALAVTVPSQAQAPAARAEDVSSVDGLIKALYDVISGPAGQERNWDRMRSLFAPGARLMPTRPPQTAADSGAMQVWSVEDYITKAGPNLSKSGFFEREIGRVMDRYGNIVQLFSTYDSKRKLDDPKPFMRGINSIQAWYDGKRWWIVSIFWEGESASNPIPGKYLKTGP
jgi:hypothetical protein